MTTLTEIQALIDKQLEGVRENFYLHQSGHIKTLLKIIDQYQRLGKRVQHDKDCASYILDGFGTGYFLCDCGLSAELDAIKKELEV